MAVQWLHVYGTDHGDSGAISAGYAGKQATTVSFGPTDTPTLYKNFRLGLSGYRASRGLVFVAIGSAPSAVYTAMVAASPFQSSWHNEYGKYVWAHQTFALTSLPTTNTGNRTDFSIELQPTTSRSMGIGDKIFFVVWILDMANTTDALNFQYWYEYDFKELLPI